MSRKLVWIEQPRFRGFGCSECGWRFQPSGGPTGASFDEMMHNFEYSATKSLHPMFAPISQEPRARGARTLNNSKCQDWEKLYRAALLESDRSKLLQRIENAEAAILERSRSLSKSPGNHEKEQGVITRALHILSLLREPGQKQ